MYTLTFMLTAKRQKSMNKEHGPRNKTVWVLIPVPGTYCFCDLRQLDCPWTSSSEKVFLLHWDMALVNALYSNVKLHGLGIMKSG